MTELDRFLSLLSLARMSARLRHGDGYDAAVAPLVRDLERHSAPEAIAARSRELYEAAQLSGDDARAVLVVAATLEVGERRRARARMPPQGVA